MKRTLDGYILGHAAVALLLAWEGYRLVRDVLGNTAEVCASRQTLPALLAQRPGLLPDWTFVACGAAAAFLASLAGAAGLFTEPRGARGRSDIVADQAILAVLYLLVAAIFVYEAIGLTQVGGNEPITYFVRCVVASEKARGGVPVWSYVVIATVCAQVGYWLLPLRRWPASGSGEPGEGGQATGQAGGAA